MLRSIAGKSPTGLADQRRVRADVAMNVLQYGTAIVAIFVVMILASFR